MKNIIVIIKKQIKDTIKNKTVLIQFILFPILTIIMENAIKMDGMPEMFFTKLFSIMYIGMAPLTAMAAIISEEKEKNTLRVLMMANVKPWQYLIGVGVYVWTICMLGAGIMATGLDRENVLAYMLIMGAGFVLSILAGACVGIYSKNQMVSTSVVMPVMMILSFAPMLSLFNDKIAKVSKVLYTQQMRLILDNMKLADIKTESAIIIMVNAVIVLALFFIIFRRKGLE